MVRIRLVGMGRIEGGFTCCKAWLSMKRLNLVR